MKVSTKKTGLIVLAIGALVATLFYYNNNNSPANRRDESNKTLGSNTDVLTSGETKEFNIVVRQWTYEPNEIVVNAGDQVVLNIESTDVTHSFTLLEFGVDEFGNVGINSVLEPGDRVRIEFVADQIGEFVFGCDVVCGKGHSKMLGKIIVQDT